MHRMLFACFCVVTICLAAFTHGHSAARAPSETTPTITPTTGKFDIYFEITIDSSLPSNATIGCEATFNVQGENTTFKDAMAVAGTRSGNQATCVVPMYYSWLLAHPGSDTISITYDVEVPPEAPGSPINLPYRQTVQSASIPVPTSGTASHIYLNVTL